MGKHYDLVIFDWDGTLVDSADHIVASMQAAFSEQGLIVPSNEMVKNIIGLGLKEAIIELNGPSSDRQIESLRTSYSKHFVRLDAEVLPVFNGVYSLLSELNQQQRLSAVATGKSRKGLDHGLSRFSESQLFVTSRCADETSSKPNPLMLSEILAETGVDKGRAVMVGDSVYDMEMAQNLGMDAIAVNYGVHCTDRLNAFKPVAVADDVISLAEFLL